MQQKMSNPIDQNLDRWEEERFHIARQVIPPDVIQACRDMLADVTDRMIHTLKAEGLIADEGKHLPFETRFATVANAHANRFGRGWRKAVAERATFDLHGVPKLVDVVEKILGTDVLGHPVFNARPKLPGQQLTVVPWHQDSSYFGDATAKSRILTAWVPFVPVDETNGCLQVERGSHRRGLMEHRVEALEGQFLEIPPEKIDTTQVVNCPMQPGDVLLFDNLTVHRSLPSRSPTIRWSIDVRFVRDGDPPGNIGWGTPGWDWIIRSKTRPPTPFEEWKEKTDAFGW